MSTLAKLTKIRADWYRARGNHQAAYDLYAKVVRAYEKPAALSLDLADALSLQGQMASKLERFQDAVDALSRAIVIRREIIGQDDWPLSGLHDMLGGLYFLLLADFQAALSHYEAAFRIRTALLPDHPATAQSVLRLAQVYQVLGRYTDAYSLLEVATRILSRTREPDHPETIAAASALASNYLALGFHDLAQSTVVQALDALGSDLDHADPGTVVVLLTTLASAQNHKSDYRAAIRYCRQALAMCKASGVQRLLESQALNALAFAYIGIAEYQQSLAFAHQALSIQEAQLGKDHFIVSDTLTTLSHGYHSAGRIDKSFPLLLEAIRIGEKGRGPDHPLTAIAIVNLGKAYLSLGDHIKAYEQYHRALDICRRTLGDRHPFTLTCMINLAGASCSAGDFNTAVRLSEDAQNGIESRFGSEHHLTAVALDTYAQALSGLHRFFDSLPLFQRSMAIRERTFGREHPTFAIGLINLASAYQDNGDPDTALPMVEQALGSLTASLGANNPTTIECSSRLATLYHAKGMVRLGICQLKHSVNAQQEQRQLVSSIGTNELTTYTRKVESTYQLLASWLATEDRLPEVLQVLDLLAESEYFDFIRRSIHDDPRSSRVAYNLLELNWLRRFEEVTNRLADIGISIRKFDLVPESERTPANIERHRQLQSALLQAQANYSSFISEMKSGYGRWASDDTQEAPKSTLDNLRQMQVTIEKLGPDVALMQYFVRDDRMGVLLTTATRQSEYEFAKPSDLTYKIIRFWKSLATRGADIIPQAGELFDLLVAPIATTLDKIGARTIMLYPDGELRLIPFCALHDGQQFLLERWSFPIFSPLAKHSLCDRPGSAWNAAGFGVSKRIGEHPALPAVPEELSAVVDTDGHGVLPGVMYLDEEFTSARLHETTAGKYSVVHVASHFQFMRGTEEDSYLLLGDGTKLSLAQIRSGYWNFSNIDLLTLSACETALGGNLTRQSGKEVDGLGVTVQRKGAKSVIATLWRVADHSTAIFMREFYMARQSNHLPKSEALQLAQISLLNGTYAPTSDMSTNSEEASSLDQTGTTSPYAHPFYWAPFVLMGNWQ